MHVRIHVARIMHNRYVAKALTLPDDEQSHICGEGMHYLMTRLGRALLDYANGMIGRARISSITEWPMHREW